MYAFEFDVAISGDAELSAGLLLILVAFPSVNPKTFGIIPGLRRITIRNGTENCFRSGDCIDFRKQFGVFFAGFTKGHKPWNC